MGKEPSGTAFNSLIQLEIEKGKPRNPFINAGAIVMCDILISSMKARKKDYLQNYLAFIHDVSGCNTINYNTDIADSERSCGYLNAAIANMLKYYDLIDGRVRACPEGQTGIIQVYSAPTDEEKAYLIEECGIDEHTLNSALDEDEISRVEYEQNHIAVIMKRPGNVQIQSRMAFRVSSVGAFLFRDRMIVVQSDVMPLFEHGKMPLRGNSVQGVLLRLLHHATHHFLQHLRIIRNISDEIENKIEFAVTNKSLVNMFALMKCLTYYESATSANQVLLRRLRNDAGRIGFDQVASAQVLSAVVARRHLRDLHAVLANLYLVA